MGTKYSNLEELRRKKDLLKKDVSKMEHIITFDNVKESLSAFTDGFTDPFLKEVPKVEGGTKVTLNNEAVIQKVRSEVKENLLNKDTMLNLASTASKNGLVEDALKVGAAAFVGNFAKKNLYHSSWKKKIIGLALIYLAPIALRFLRTKLEAYQKNKRVSSLEQLI